MVRHPWRVGIELGAEELYGGRNNFVYDDISALFGAAAQIEIFREDALQDTLLSLDGGNTCWEVTGDCDLDADVVGWWDCLDDVFTYAADHTD